MPNPYTWRSAVRDESMFFGRREAIDAIGARLYGSVPISISVLGPRRIGKSSLLWQLSRPSSGLIESAHVDRLKLVYIDFQEAGRLTTCSLLRWILRNLNAQVELAALDEDQLKELMLQTLEGLSEDNASLVVLFDEFDSAARYISLETLDYLRALAKYNMAYITATKRPLNDICKTLESSSFSNIFTLYSLGLLQRQEAYDLIVKPSAVQGIDFTQKDIEFVLDTAGLHPYLLQVTCFHLFESRSTQTPITDYVEIEKQVTAEVVPFIHRKFHGLTENAKQAVAALLSGQRLGHDTLDELYREGIVDLNGELFCSLFQRFAESFVKSRARQHARDPVRVLYAPNSEDYIDWELHVSPDGHVVARSEVEGQASASISIQMPDEIQKIVRLIEQRSTNYSQLELIGRLLYGWLFPSQIRAHLNQTEAHARLKKAKVRLRLRVEATQIASLPLELIYRPDQGHFLAINPDTVISRYLHMPLPAERVRRRKSALHMLTVIADPTDQARMNPDRWEDIMRLAMTDALSSNQMTMHVIKHATRRQIRNALLNQKPDIVQFVGHVTYRAGEVCLALVDGNTGKTWSVNEQSFAALFLGNDDHLGLISLTTCESADSSNSHGLLGIAPKFLAHGVPAVVAMRYAVHIRIAEVFLEDLYTCVAARKPIDWAVQSARNAISLEFGLDGREFATPVLYMRAKDGNIF